MNVKDDRKKNGVKFFYEFVTALTAWTAIVFQASLTTGSLVNLFSYFTILTNLLIALCLTTILFFPKTKAAHFFNRHSVQSAITLYIFIVALVYNTVLRGIVTLHGWHFFVDSLLHVAVPILFILYWFLFVPKAVLHWKHGLYWIYFPLAYLIYSLVRGAFYGWYPYPFLNVITFGYPKVFLNIFIMITVFFLSGLALILLNRVLGNRKTPFQ